ncbi:hypothetical protein MBLNU457_1213t1 [Dothideomycetes sp. NU457]
MTDSSGHGLGYGQFGECTYDIEKKQWIWKQDFQDTSHFQSVGVSTSAISAPNAAFEKHAPKAPLDSLTLELISAVPSLGSAWELLHETLPSLSTPLDIADDDQSHHGDCLAIGRISDDLYNRERVTVAAFPGDASGTVLRLVQIRRQRQGWDNDKSIWLNVPTIQGESGTWDAQSPIQQVLFSRSEEEQSCLLAVRTLQSTFILRPHLRGHTVSSNSASRLEIAVLVALPFDDLETYAHVDICFNPWYTLQFATIDKVGHWSVWDVGHSRESGRVAKLSLAATGYVDGEEKSDTSEAEPENSYRISWIGDLSTIMVCGTNSVSIVEIGSKLPITNSLDLGRNSLVLDLQDDPLHLGRVVLLTNAHIFYLAMGSGNNATGLEVSLKAQHFRDFADESLRLSASAFGEKTRLFIRSSASPSVTVHDIDFGQEPISITAASLWTPADSLPRQALSMKVLSADFEESIRWASFGAKGSQYKDSGIHFCQALMLLKNNSIRTQLLCSGSMQTMSDLRVVAPDWRSKTASSSARTENSSFIVDVTEDNPGIHRLVNSRTTLQSGLRRSDKLVDNRRSAVNYEAVYNKISEMRSRSGEDLSDILERIKATMADSSVVESFSMHSLSKYATQEVLVNDLYEASEGFQALLGLHDSQRPDTENRLQISRVPGINLFGLAGPVSGDNTMIDLYNNLVSHWLSPLNPLVAGRIRLAKEQLIRGIAAELCISSHCIRKQLPAATSTQDLETQYTNSQADALLPSSQVAPPSSLPTPSPSTSPFLHGHAFAEAQSTALDRLRSYTTIDPPSTPPTISTSTTRILSHWTLHSDPSKYSWAATTTALTRDSEASLAASALSDRQRARLRRKSEKLAARTARENALAQNYTSTLSQAPALMSSSQIPLSSQIPTASQSHGTEKKRRRDDAGFTIPFRPSPSPVRTTGLGIVSSPALQRSGQTQGFSQMLPPASSQSVAGPGAASQIEPGRFGGRTSLGPKRKKRRTEGF